MVKYGILFNLLLLICAACRCQVWDHQLTGSQSLHTALYGSHKLYFAGRGMVYGIQKNGDYQTNGNFFPRSAYQTLRFFGRLSENSIQHPFGENYFSNQQLTGINMAQPGHLNEGLTTAAIKISRSQHQSRARQQTARDRRLARRHTPSVLSASLKPLLVSGVRRNLEGEVGAFTTVIKPVTRVTQTGDAGYQRWWIAALIVWMFSGNLYLMYRCRINHLARITTLRTRISQDLHDNIGSTLSSISMFCHAAIQKNEKGSLSESKRILEIIGETSREVMKELNETVWLINPVNDNLQMIIQRISNYALPICTTRNIHFEIKLPDSIQTLDLCAEKRKAIYLFLKEAINNCLKYAAAKSVVVYFVKNQKTLFVSVKDDGIGFIANNSFNGNGLNNMKQRSKDIKGFVEVKSIVQRGTEIKLQVPLSGVEG